MKPGWNPEHFIPQLRETTRNAEERAYFVDRQLTRIEELTRHSKLNLKQSIQLLSSMSVYGTWLAMKGLVEVSDGAASGWNCIHGSFLFRAWATQFAIAQLYASKKGKRLLRDDVPECMAHAIAIGDEAFADFFGQCLVKSFNDGDGRFVHQHQTPYEPFVITLYGLWRGQRVNVADSEAWNLGPYAGIVEYWDAPSGLDRAIQSACDYHCDPNGYLSYANVPYFLFPVEILAIERIRKQLGLGEATHNHVLLQSKYARPVSSTFENDLLSKAVEVLSFNYPQK